MESSAYGAPLSGGAFDFRSFLKQPQTILCVFSWVFSILVFGTITSEGHFNPATLQSDAKCMFNQNDGACDYGSGLGVLAFLACIILLILDAYFPQISNAKERRNIVIGDFGFSAVMTFLWFTCFCFLANQWSHTTHVTDVNIANAARTTITFAFFSIASWGLLTFFALLRYRQGVNELNQNYTDPANDHTTPYPPFGSHSQDAYQQSPFASTTQPKGEGGYQAPVY